MGKEIRKLLSFFKDTMSVSFCCKEENLSSKMNRVRGIAKLVFVPIGEPNVKVELWPFSKTLALDFYFLLFLCQFSQVGEWQENPILIPEWTYFYCPGTTLV